MRFQYNVDCPMIHRSIGPVSSVLERNKNVKTVNETSLKIAKRDFFLWDGYLKQFL